MGSEGHDGEVVGMLLRKVLEQIAFGSLVAHRETYDEFHKDAATIWRAKELIDRIEKIHPNFYPSPGQKGVSEIFGVQRHFDQVEDG